MIRREVEKSVENRETGLVVIDEVQRVPMLLAEIHYLMENVKGVRFVLTGSSARNLKRGGADLLAGRAVERYLYPIYLKEEIKNEGIVRNVGSFARFLEVAAAQSGEILNASAVARDCQVSQRTVVSFYEILVDTFVGFRLDPWRKSVRKQLAGHPKFYLFDTGVVYAINHRLSAPP